MKESEERNDKGGESWRKRNVRPEQRVGKIYWRRCGNTLLHGELSVFLCSYAWAASSPAFFWTVCVSVCLHISVLQNTVSPGIWWNCTAININVFRRKTFEVWTFSVVTCFSPSAFIVLFLCAMMIIIVWHIVSLIHHINMRILAYIPVNLKTDILFICFFSLFELFCLR